MKKIFTLLAFSSIVAASFSQLPGNSIKLTGNGQLVSIPDAASATLNNDLTLEAWVYYTCANGTASQSILTKGWCGQRWSWYFHIGDGKITFGKFNNANCSLGQAFYESAQTVPYNTWTHVAMVHSLNTVTFYMNGQPLASSLTSGSAFNGFQASTEPVRIGAYRRLDGALVSTPIGNIDDVRLWHTARTAAEIAANYNTALNGTEPGLYCYWKLDESGSGAGITCANSATATGATFNGTTAGAVALVNNNTITNAMPVCTPALWLRADSTLTKDVANKVSIWNDVSGNSRNATQATPANQPTWMPNIFNGRPALWFDGVNGNYFLENTTQTPVPVAGSARTYFVVAKADCNASGYKGGHLFSNRRTSQASTLEFTDNGSGGIFHAGNLCCNHPSANVSFAEGQKIFVGAWRTAGAGTNIDFRMNGTQATVTNASFVSDNGAAGYAVGDRRDGISGNDWQGYISEIIVYDRAVTDLERSQTESYLSKKYQSVYLPSQFTGLPIAKTTNDVALDDGSWKHTYNSSDPTSLIASVKDNCLALGIITDTVYLEPGTVGGNAGSQRFLRRHYVIKAGSNPAGTKRIRLYFTIQEFNDLKAATNNINTINDLSVTKYSGPTEDGNYNVADATSLTYIPSSSITAGTLSGMYYLEFDVSGFSEFWIHGGAAVLPLRLLDLSVTKVKGLPTLRWTTTNESDMAFYEAEKSTNGLQFHAIGKVTAKNGSANSYSFTDSTDNISSPVIYYRLKQFTNAGGFTYSSVVKLSGNRQLEISVSPVPAHDRIRIRSAAAISYIEILNTTGIVVKKLIPSADQWYNISELPNGIYFLRVSAGGMVQVEKMVVGQ